MYEVTRSGNLISNKLNGGENCFLQISKPLPTTPQYNLQPKCSSKLKYYSYPFISLNAQQKNKGFSVDYIDKTNKSMKIALIICKCFLFRAVAMPAERKWSYS